MVVLGTGAAGLTPAVVAADGGASVGVFERRADRWYVGLAARHVTAS